MDLMDGTRVFEILVIIFFLVLLAASIFMFINFYICDGHNCKAFDMANKKGSEGTKANVSAVLSELYNDGIWPIPYIGATFLTPICLWVLSIPITIKTFSMIFFTSFVVIYFLFSFFGHHYLRPITAYVSEYVQDQCPGISDSTLNENETNFAPGTPSSSNGSTTRKRQDSLGAQVIYNEDEQLDDPICQQQLGSDMDQIINGNVGGMFGSFADGVGITFATPVNIF